MGTQTSTKDLTPYVEAALRGASVNSQAKEAGVPAVTLRRLVIAHPGYAAAKAAGHIKEKPRYSDAELRHAPHIIAVMEGASVADAAARFGMGEEAVRTHLRRAFPGSTNAAMAARLDWVRRRGGDAWHSASKAQAIELEKNLVQPAQNVQSASPMTAFREQYDAGAGDSASSQVTTGNIGESRTTLTDPASGSSAGDQETHDSSTSYQGMLTHHIHVLPMISWDTARDWDPASGEIPKEKILGYRAAARPSTQHSYVLTVEDQAMTAPPGATLSFPVGCQIFVDAGRAHEATAGKRVVAKVLSTNQLVFRTLQTDAATGKRWLEPLNQMYGVITDAFVVVGLVFGKWEDVEV